MVTQVGSAQTAASAFHDANPLPAIAIATTACSIPLIPAATECLVLMIEGLSMPGGIGDAAVRWASGAAELEEAAKALAEVVESIPEDAWKGGDKEAFDAKIEQIRTQFDTGHIFCDVVSDVLIVFGSLLVAYDLMATAMGAVLMAEAIALAATIASIIGNLGASEAEEAAYTAEAEAFAGVLETSNTILQTTAQVLGGALAVGLVVFEGIELSEGDTNVGGDVLKGTAIAFPDLALAALSGAAGSAGKEGGGGLLSKIPGVSKLADYAPGELAKKIVKPAENFFLPTGKHAANRLAHEGTQKIVDGLAGRAGDKAGEKAAAPATKGIKTGVNGGE